MNTFKELNFSDEDLNNIFMNLYDERVCLIDKTNNGVCSGCAECCSSILPISEEEYLQIGRYIHKHNIMGYRNPLDLYWHYKCPFLDSSHKCRIYSIRPTICREFKCDLQKKGIFNVSAFTDVERKAVNMWDLFYKDL